MERNIVTKRRINNNSGVPLLLSVIILQLMIICGLGFYITTIEPQVVEKIIYVPEQNQDIQTQQPQPAQQYTPPPAKEYRQIQTFTGVGDKTTDTVTITGEKWAVAWQTIPTSGVEEYAIFGVFIYPEGETVSYIAYFDGLEGETVIYVGKGNYYFSVIVANIDQWQIDVYDYY